MPPIKPKYSLSDNETSSKAGKKFTDREEFLNAFYNAFNSKVKDSHKILVYYGVGGIGKTALCKELLKRVTEEKPNTVWAAIDFDTPAYREQETFLFVLRNFLNDKFHISFPSFDIAYTVYWQKTHPQIQLTKENFPLLKGKNILDGIVKEYGEIPLIGFVQKLTKAISSDGNILSEWWKKRGLKELANLPALEAKEIFVYLTTFWSNDFKDYLEKENKQAVLFLDTYDSFLENVIAQEGFYNRDEWIRELVNKLPEVIWVICGRGKLRWNEQDVIWDKYIQQHLIGSLSVDDSKYFLKTCGVEKPEVQDIIIEASNGIPYFLDLAVDTYYEINNRYKRDPDAKDFTKIQQKVLDRFLRYLDREEIETLEVLSCTRVWDDQIFQMLMQKFNTGYPKNEMNNLCRFSFIRETGQTKHFSMHELMRESLQLKLDKDLLKLIHQYLFEYYNSKLTELEIKNISEIEKQALTEAFHHGKIAMAHFALCDWFYKVRTIFFDAAQFKIIFPLSEELLKISENIFGKDSFDYIKAMRKHTQIILWSGKYKIAESLFSNILNYCERNLSQNSYETGLGLFDLADSYYFQGRFSEAEPYYKRALEIFKTEAGNEDKNFALVLNNLGIIYAILGKYDKAIPLFKQLLVIQEKIFGAEHFEVARSLMNLANISFDIRKFSEAEAYAKKALDVYQKALGEFHPEVGKALNTIGNIYLEEKRYSEAQPYYEKAKKLFEETFGEEYSEVGGIINNLAYLNYKLEKYDDALFLYQKALMIFQKLFGPEHPGIAKIVDNTALVYKIKKKYKEAEKLFEQAISIFLKTIGELNSDIAETYEHYANLLEEENKIEKAIEYYEKTLVSFEASLGLYHYHTIEIKEKVKNLKSQH